MLEKFHGQTLRYRHLSRNSWCIVKIQQWSGAALDYSWISYEAIIFFFSALKPLREDRLDHVYPELAGIRKMKPLNFQLTGSGRARDAIATGAAFAVVVGLAAGGYGGGVVLQLLLNLM